MENLFFKIEIIDFFYIKMLTELLEFDKFRSIN